jgi:A/G-specific adenine glycosylase
MADFHRLTIDWYRQNKRDLPWRNTKNPYKIWLSEIILQQTRVDQGMNYYLKFIRNYPTIFDLANANEHEVLNDWQGLGYYSRARNLHFTAKHIASELNGIFPNQYSEIIKLKGIGEYTAAAISSFSFDLPHAVLDGNVYRVLSRVFDIATPIDSTEGKKEFQNLANELIDKDNPAIYNQSIMEFGAMLCTPVNPNCENCPLTEKCLSFANNTIKERPLKEKKTKVRNRYFNFAIFKENDQILIEKRTSKDIWQHLYQFPLYETEKEMSNEDAISFFQETIDLNPSDFSKPIKHILSHQRIFTVFYIFNQLPNKKGENWIQIDKSLIDNYPLPRVIDRFLEDYNL